MEAIGRARRLLLGNVYNGLMIDGFHDAHAAPLINGSPRKLWLARTGDIVASTRRFDPDFVKYVARMTGVAEQAVERVVFAPDWAGSAPPLAPLLDGARPVVQPYALDRAAAAVAQRHDLAIEGYEGLPSDRLIEAIERLNTKSGFREAANRLGIPVPPGGSCAGRDALVELAESLRAQHGRIIVKFDRSSNGFGNLVVSEDDGPGLAALLDAHLERFDALPPRFTVEAFLTFVSLPSIELVVGDDGLAFSYICDQRSGPRGGMATPHPGLGAEQVAQLHVAGTAFGRYLAGIGYRGTFDVDGGCTPQGEIVLTEANVRRTAGTHLHEIARRLLGSDYLETHTWLSGSMPTGLGFAALLDAIGTARLGYDPGARRGVLLPVDHATGERCIYMIIAATHADALAMETDLARLVGRTTQ